MSAQVAHVVDLSPKFANAAVEQRPEIQSRIIHDSLISSSTERAIYAYFSFFN